MADPLRTEPHPSAERDLRVDVHHAHRHALAALDDASAGPLAAVAWVSTHLGAADRVLYPIVERALPEGRARVAAQRRADGRLHTAAYRLDRHVTGDVHLGGSSRRDLVDDLRRALAEHAAGESGLLDDLCAVLDPGQQAALAERLAAALLRSPTRPHPSVHPSRALRGAVLWAESVVDRTRDLLDSRVVPTPRTAPVARPVTRWGAWATAAPPVTPENSEDAATRRP